MVFGEKSAKISSENSHYIKEENYGGKAMISNIYMPARCIVGRGCVEQSGGIFASAGKRCLIVTGRSSASSAALSATRKKPCKARG